MPDIAGTAVSKNPRRAYERHVAAAAKRGVAPKGHYLPSKEDDIVLRELSRLYDPDSRDHNHYQYHRQWWMSVAYLVGLQWTNWNEEANRVQEKKVKPWRKLYVANRILPMVMRTYSRLVAERLNYRALPPSAEQADIKAAELADRVIEHAKYASRFDKARAAAILWAVVAGTGFGKLVWNPHKGAKVEIDGKPVAIGEFEAESASPFQMRVPPICNTMEHLPWIVQITTRQMDYLYQKWPEKAQYVVPDPGGSKENFLEDRVNALVGIRGLASTSDTEQDPNVVRVSELWKIPSKEFPDGLHAIVANGVVLDKQFVNPYVGMGIGLPFFKYDFIQIPGRFWGMGLVEQLIFPQREYNVSRSQVIENQNLMSRPKWSAPKGHGMPGSAISNEPGEILEYNPALPKPEQVQVAPLPNYVLDHQQRCVQEMQDIGAQQDVTQGKAPASMRSGIAVQMLQQADMMVLGGPRIAIAETDVVAAEFMIALAKEQYREERVLAILGPERSWDMVKFTGKDLRGVAAVRLYAEGGMLDSAAARQQNILDYVQLGILDPKDPKDKAQILQALQVGSVDRYVSSMTIDQRVAELENELMSRPEEQGGPIGVPAADWEDHVAHVETHNLFRKSLAFRGLPEDTKLVFATHVGFHQEFLRQLMEAQMAQNESAKGAPGEKGEPSAPKKGPGGDSPKGGGGEGRPAGGGAKNDQAT